MVARNPKDEPQNEVAPQEPVIRPDHYFDIVQHSVSRRSDGKLRLNQEVIFREFADTSQELVDKNMHVMTQTVPAILTACAELATAQGTPPGKVGK